MLQNLLVGMDTRGQNKGRFSFAKSEGFVMAPMFEVLVSAPDFFFRKDWHIDPHYNIEEYYSNSNSMHQSSNIRPIRIAPLVDNTRQLLWNIVEPGDPYDIRKSMIAKLPGNNKFMGPHLQIVCLLQAAEIERLCSSLDEFQVRFRERDRVELDRHSYEVQVKELTEKLVIEENHEIENQKFKEFIRKQSKEMEQLQRQREIPDNTQCYEDCLKQLQAALTQSQECKTQNQQLSLQLEQMRNTQNLNKKELTSLQEELAKHSTLNESIREYEGRFHIMAEEIDRLNNLLRDKSRELSEHYNRFKLIEGEKQQRQQKLVQYESKILALQQNLTNLEKKHRQNASSLEDLEEAKALLQSYENSLTKFSLEVDRLNTVLRKKLTELEECKTKNNQYQYQLRAAQNIQNQNNELRFKYSDVCRQMDQCEKRIRAYTQENERLNFTIIRVIEELNHSQIKVKNCQKQFDNQLKNIAILEEQLRQERQKSQKNINKLFMLFSNSQNIDQTEYLLNTTVDEKVEYCTNSLNVINQSLNCIHNLQACNSYDQNNFKPFDILNLQQKVTLLQQTFKQLSYQLTSSKQIHTNLQKQNQYLKTQMQNMTVEVKKYEPRIKYLVSQVNRLNKALSDKEIQTERSYLQLQKNYHATVVEKESFCDQNSRLKEQHMKLQNQIEHIKRENIKHEQRLAEMGNYYQKILLFSQEIERLNSLLQSRDQQLKIYTTKQSDQRIIEAQQLMLPKVKNQQSEKVSKIESQERQHQFRSQSQADLSNIAGNIQEQNRRQKSLIVQNQLSLIKKQLENYIIRYNEIILQNNKNKYQLKQYQKKIGQLSDQFAKMQNLVLVLQKEKDFNFQQHTQKNRMLALQIQRMRSLIEQQRIQLANQRLRFVDNQRLARQNVQQLALFTILSAQIESLRERVHNLQSPLLERHISQIDSYFL